MLNWTSFIPMDLEKTLECGCQVLILNPFQHAYIILFHENAKAEHKKEINQIIDKSTEEQARINNLMSLNNA